MLVESAAESGESTGSPGSREGIEADLEVPVEELQIAGCTEDFLEQGARLVVGTSVVRSEKAGEDGLGVVDAHADGVGEQLALLVEEQGVGGQLSEREAAGGGLQGGLELGDLEAREPDSRCGWSGFESGGRRPGG